MASEERLSGSYGEMEEQNERIECATYNIPDPSVKGRVNMLLLQGPSVYDAWFSAASNQIAQVLLTLPTSFAQLGYASGVALQVVYGIMGSWACYMITWLYMEYRTRMEREGHTFKTHVIQWFEVLDGLLGRKWKYVGLAFNCVYLLFAAITQLIACGSNIFLLNNDVDKREWTYVFGACCLVTIFIPSFRNYRLYSCFGVVAITYTSWYMTVAALVYGYDLWYSLNGMSVILYFSSVGAGSNPPWPQVFGSLLYRRHQHPLHLRQPGCHRAWTAMMETSQTPYSIRGPFALHEHNITS